MQTQKGSTTAVAGCHSEIDVSVTAATTVPLPHTGSYTYMIRVAAVPPRFQEHDFEICALAFSKDERLLATVGNERSVQHSTPNQADVASSC